MTHTVKFFFKCKNCYGSCSNPQKKYYVKSTENNRVTSNSGSSCVRSLKNSDLNETSVEIGLTKSTQDYNDV